MDLQSLVAAHMPDRRRPSRMSASAEDRYYGARIVRRPKPLLLAQIAATAGVILLLVGIAQA